MSSACSDSRRVTNLIDIYPLLKALFNLTLESTENDVIKMKRRLLEAFLIDVIPQITNCFANSLIPQLNSNLQIDVHYVVHYVVHYGSRI